MLLGDAESPAPTAAVPSSSNTVANGFRKASEASPPAADAAAAPAADTPGMWSAEARAAADSTPDAAGPSGLNAETSAQHPPQQPQHPLQPQQPPPQQPQQPHPQPEASHAAAEAGQCPICLEDLAGLTLHVYPCGHTFCDACSTKVQQGFDMSIPRPIMSTKGTFLNHSQSCLVHLYGLCRCKRHPLSSEQQTAAKLATLASAPASAL